MRCLILFFSFVFIAFAQDFVPQEDFSENAKQQREFFQAKGYLWLKGFYSPEQINLLKTWAHTIDMASQKMISLSKASGCSLQDLAKTLPGSLIVVAESTNPEKACRAEDFLSVYPDLQKLILGTVTSYIGQVFQEPYAIFKDKINFKWPRGGAFSPHQDFPAYEFLGPKEHITAMICIDEATIENGCLYIAEDWRTSLKDVSELDADTLCLGRSVLPYNVGGKEHGSLRSDIVAKIHWLPILAKPGDVVLFDSYIPHYSKPNDSTMSRRAMFITHNRLMDGDFKAAYFYAKRMDPDHPMFHFATPTKARTKD